MLDAGNGSRRQVGIGDNANSFVYFRVKGRALRFNRVHAIPGHHVVKSFQGQFYTLVKGRLAKGRAFTTRAGDCVGQRPFQVIGQGEYIAQQRFFFLLRPGLI